MFSIFSSNRDILNEKEHIPYWIIANELGVHENTLRNWMKTEMSPERKKKVLDVIKGLKKQLQEAN
ncbi:hypothetical protein [Pseudogracilibacillus auburnensis]|uniref:hypothetical protein n=1 Tax=Pseudogracilibacillus auburnensis TaxID=1494959 RepID=UPI001A966EF6|nr:hypothetical protein [Pseudogracilibacillus auburnensis]MBO1005757.1 hypothetical protein [Pseudogracilibacillus auburnensis]